MKQSVTGHPRRMKGDRPVPTMASILPGSPFHNRMILREEGDDERQMRSTPDATPAALYISEAKR